MQESGTNHWVQLKEWRHLFPILKRIAKGTPPSPPRRPTDRVRPGGRSGAAATRGLRAPGSDRSGQQGGKPGRGGAERPCREPTGQEQSRAAAAQGVLLPGGGEGWDPLTGARQATSGGLREVGPPAESGAVAAAGGSLPGGGCSACELQGPRLGRPGTAQPLLVASLAPWKGFGHPGFQDPNSSSAAATGPQLGPELSHALRLGSLAKQRGWRLISSQELARTQNLTPHT